MNHVKPKHRFLEGFPDATFPPSRLYHELGESLIREVVRDQHERMWQSGLKSLFGNRAHFEKAVGHTEQYFVEMLGGPKCYTPHRGEARLGKRHLPFNLTEAHRKIWLQCFFWSMQRHGVSSSVAETLWCWVEPLSMRFLNPKPHPDDIPRYPFHSMNGVTLAKDHD